MYTPGYLVVRSVDDTAVVNDYEDDVLTLLLPDFP